MADHGRLLRPLADEIHFDATVAWIVDRLMPELGQIESGAQFAIDAREEIQIERRGDAGGIVVGGDERMRVPLQIDADHEAALRSQRARHAGEALPRLRRRQTADRRARAKANLRTRAQATGSDT